MTTAAVISCGLAEELQNTGPAFPAAREGWLFAVDGKEARRPMAVLTTTDGIQLPHPKPGVFFAPTAEEGVLLDLPANKYFGLTGISARLWMAIEQGGRYEDLLQVAARSTAKLAMDPGVLVRHQIERWQDAGLLVQGPSGHESGLPLPRPQTARAASSLGTCEIDKARFSLYRLIQHAWNSIWVRNHIRWSGLSSAIRAIQLLPAPAAQPPQMELLRHLGQAMRGYQAARRPLAQGRPDCLTRSLALLRTLRQEGIDASICIGVRKCPFAAHAWVEAGGLTVNDTVENTSQYFVIVSF